MRIFNLFCCALLLTYPSFLQAAADPKAKEETTSEKAPDAQKDGASSPSASSSHRVKFSISVSRFGDNNVSSLVSYLFYFETDDRDTKAKIYERMQWFKAQITPKLTEYLSNPAHNPKDIRQVKRFMWRLTNRFMNKRFPKKDDQGNPKMHNYITDVFINKIFERKL